MTPASLSLSFSLLSKGSFVKRLFPSSPSSIAFQILDSASLQFCFQMRSEQLFIRGEEEEEGPYKKGISLF